MQIAAKVLMRDINEGQCEDANRATATMSAWFSISGSIKESAEMVTLKINILFLSERNEHLVFIMSDEVRAKEETTTKKQTLCF
jgi:hypothetical protein